MGIKKADSVDETGRRPEFVSCFHSRVTKHVADDLELRCAVAGSPPPQLTWHHNGELLDTNDPRFSLSQSCRKLLITRLATEDAGHYTCTAKNQLAEASISCTLVVRGSLGSNLPKILQQPHNVDAQEGKGAELSCVVQCPSKLFPSFLWSKEGQELTETSVRLYKREDTGADRVKAILEFPSVQKTDQGRYQLRFYNTFGNVTTDEIALRVI